ncbi:MAG: hypothetical protein WC637_08600 [Victivallales bacterium]|jgi:predicted transcriptional regulator
MNIPSQTLSTIQQKKLKRCLDKNLYGTIEEYRKKWGLTWEQGIEVVYYDFISSVWKDECLCENCPSRVK